MVSKPRRKGGGGGGGGGRFDNWSCVLCGGLGSEDIISDNILGLKMLLRYLGIDSARVLLPNICSRQRKETTADSEESSSDEEYCLCYDCWRLTNSFLKTYRKHERLRLELEKNVLSVKSHLEKGSGKRRRRDSGQAEEDQDKNKGKLKQVVLLKCAQKLVATVPRVTLSNIGNGRDQALTDSDHPPPTLGAGGKETLELVPYNTYQNSDVGSKLTENCETEKDEAQNGSENVDSVVAVVIPGGVSQQEAENQQQTTTATSSTPKPPDNQEKSKHVTLDVVTVVESAQIMTVASNVSHLPSGADLGTYKCVHCGLTSAKRHFLWVHMRVLHPLQYYSALVAPGTTEQSAKLAVQRALGKLVPLRLGNRLCLQCPYCPFLSTSKWICQRHMLEDHTSTLFAQFEGPSSYAPAIIIGTPNSNPENTCNIVAMRRCVQQNIVSALVVERSSKGPPPEQGTPSVPVAAAALLTQIKTEPMDTNDTTVARPCYGCPFCQRKFSNNVDRKYHLLSKHKLQTCFINFPARATMSELRAALNRLMLRVKSSAGPGGIKYRCLHCTAKRFRKANINSMYYHLRNSHTKNILEELGRLRSKANMSLCPHCREYIRDSIFQQHVRVLHPFQEFSSIIPPNMTKSSWLAAIKNLTPRQQSPRMMIGQGKEEEQRHHHDPNHPADSHYSYSCCSCSSQFRCRADLRVHLVMVHTGEIINQVKLQPNPNSD